jgi:hypothetical protein
MSASTPLAWYHSRADSSARLELLAIADHDGEGGAWPSVATLARMTRLSPSTVRRSVKALVALGEVTVYLQEGGTNRTPEGRRPNRYEITLACPTTCDGTARHACRECGERADHGEGCHRDRGVTRDTPTPVTRDTPTPVTAVTPEPPKEATPEPPRASEPPPLPPHVARVWRDEGIDDEHQAALWAALLADPETVVPAARAKQRAWIVPALAKIRAGESRRNGKALDVLRKYGEECEHGTPGGAEEHPTTGQPLCPLCRSGVKS